MLVSMGEHVCAETALTQPGHSKGTRHTDCTQHDVTASFTNDLRGSSQSPRGEGLGSIWRGNLQPCKCSEFDGGAASSPDSGNSQGSPPPPRPTLPQRLR